MTDGSVPRPRLVDFFRPGRLFERLREHPRFVGPALLLAAGTLLYVEIAARKALPYVVPAILDRALVTESELRVTMQRALRACALVGPVLALPATAFVAWVMLRLMRSRETFVRVLAVSAWAGLWIAAGFVVKAALAYATGRADPPVNAGAFVHAERPLVRALLSLTNPFGVLAALWTSAGLRAFGVPRLRAAVAGSVPWAAWLVTLALVFGGSSRYSPDTPVPTGDWAQITRGPITLRYAPSFAKDAERLLAFLSTFADRLHTQLGLDPTPIRVYVYPDHRALETATGERLPVLVTASVRGADLLYLEAPGRSLVVTPERALREALRYVGLLEVAQAAKLAPRWFVEGFVHAAVYPGDARLDKEFRAALQRRGVPHYDDLLSPAFFLTSDGPLFARSLVDHVAYLEGPGAPEKIMRDVIGGTSFRDALYAHAHLTTSALEAGWVQVLQSASGAAPRPTADSTSPRLDEAAPFAKPH